MGVRRPQEDGVDDTVKAQIVQIGALASDEAGILRRFGESPMTARSVMDGGSLGSRIRQSGPRSGNDQGLRPTRPVATRSRRRCHNLTFGSPSIGHGPETSFHVCGRPQRRLAAIGMFAATKHTEASMRIYVEVVLTIIGLIGAYAALLPLVT